MNKSIFMKGSINKFILTVVALTLSQTLMAQNHPTSVNSTEPDSVAVSPQEPQALSIEGTQAVIDSITADYYDWDTVSLSGKLSADFLPISPSLKIYMEKDRLIIMSVSAPLMGEVARIEIDENEVLAVYKMKNKYSSMGLEQISAICPGGLSSLQDLILGRITLMGGGQLKREDAASLEIYPTNSDYWLLLPKQNMEEAPYVYYYLVDMETALLDRLTVLAQDGNPVGECEYEWGEKNYYLNIFTSVHNREMTISLKLNDPDAMAKRIERIELSGKYKKVSPADLMR